MISGINLNKMQENKISVDSIMEKVEDYGKTRIDLVKLQALDQTSEVISSLASNMAIIYIIFVFIFVLNIGIALWLSELIGKLYYGFFIVAGFYAIGGIIVYTFRKEWVKANVKNMIIGQWLKK